MERELKYQNNLFLAYRVILNDDGRILRIVELYDVLIHLVLKWAGIDPTQLVDGRIPNYKPKEVLKILPEHWMTDLFEFHLTNLKSKENYSKTLCNKSRGGSINYVNNQSKTFVDLF